jgi:hypothetical protein
MAETGDHPNIQENHLFVAPLLIGHRNNYKTYIFIGHTNNYKTYIYLLVIEIITKFFLLVIEIIIKNKYFVFKN